jgi:mRNA interferase HigB
MILVGADVLRRAGRDHPDAKAPIDAWVDLVEIGNWRNINEVREVYPHADGVKLRSGTVVTVFNIVGNRYRLLTVIGYTQQKVSVELFLTHAEYNKDKWKQVL